MLYRGVVSETESLNSKSEKSETLSRISGRQIWSENSDFPMQNETVWLSLDQMAELFQRDKSTISRHIKNVYSEGELIREGTVANFATVQTEGDRQVERSIEYYNRRTENEKRKLGNQRTKGAGHRGGLHADEECAFGAGGKAGGQGHGKRSEFL